MNTWRRNWLGLPLLALALVLPLGAAACSDEEDEAAEASPDPEADPDPEAGSTLTAGESVEVVLNEWSVAPAGVSFAAGAIRFAASNDGKETHELVICRDSCEAGEEAELAEVEDVEPGKEGAFVIQLEAGEYELACLIEEDGNNHYEKGMHTKITVR